MHWDYGSVLWQLFRGTTHVRVASLTMQCGRRVSRTFPRASRLAPTMARARSQSCWEDIRGYRYHGFRCRREPGCAQSMMDPGRAVLPTSSQELATARGLHRLPRAPLGGWVLDESAAFRQLPVCPESRGVAVVGVCEPKSIRAHGEGARG